MAFWRNSQYDLQSRRATIAQDVGQWDTPLPSLIGKDKFFRGPGQAPNYDWPNPSFAAVRNAAYRAAQLAQSTDQVHQFFHGLDGKDKLPTGQGTLDTRNPPARTPPRTWKAQDSVDSGLALFDAATAVGLPPGDTICSAHELRPAAPSRREYGQTSSFPLSLIGQDALNAGDQSVALPPIGPARARDYSFTASFPLELIGQDQLPVGDQRTDIAPRGFPRARDYTWLWTFPQELRGQDQFNAGVQSADLPPRGALRAREYGQATSFPLELIAQDQFNAGEQSVDLPVPTAPRRQPALEPGAQSLALANTTVAPPPGVQTTDLPARGAARARDYSFVASFPPELVGQDQRNAGQSTYDLPVPVAPRRQPALEPGVTSLALTAPPLGVQVYDLAPRGPARARDYTFVASFPLELIGQDRFNAGAQRYDLPPRAAARIQSTFEPGVTSLALTVAPVFLPYGAQLYDLPTPPAPKRARDYTWLQSFPLELIGKDQRNVGQSTELTALPPKAPARARDYSFVHPFPLELNNKDAFFRGAGVGPNYDWPNPSFKVPRAAASLAASLSQDASQVHQFTLELIGKDRFNAGAQLFDLPLIAVPRRLAALEVGAQSIALEETVAPAPTPVVPEEPKPGGLGQRRRLTRFRRGADARFLSGTLEAPTARLQATLRASWATRELTAWLTSASPGLRLRARALNPRHTQAQFAAPTPSLQSCRQSAALGCTTLAVQAAQPSLNARLRQLPPPVADESWLLAVLLSDARSALRNWQGEATKRLSNLQRQANAHAARTDAQQERLVQASLPHLRHALMAQRDAALVALPHATKASIDPQFILDNDGFKAAVALFVQAIEDLQEAGVTLGYTDTSPSDVFDLHNPYVTAAVQTLNTRISGITTTTADAIRAVIATGLAEGWTVAEMGGAIQQLGAFSDARALTIASTESRMALSLGTIAAGEEVGATQYLIADGDYDESCSAVDGTIQSANWFMANVMGHPNCRRVGTPLPAA